MDGLNLSIRLPDSWQQAAVRHLREGRDVIVQAPTGAGKTYIFELFVRNYLRGQAVYTVPTRALANDKMVEWENEGWNVGITTGDLSHNLNAQVLVATLETQKQKLIRGEGPSLLVIDEYQMLADISRGINYETAIATAPASTQLLLMSGSVANPERMADWLRRLGRDAVVVSHHERPVPQEQVHLDAIKIRVPGRVRGYLPRLIVRALMADLGPILVFAPRRKAAEELAQQLAASLPQDPPIGFSPEQRALAGDNLARLLKSRVAVHHSGLSYRQRAGLIEPLAKAGQLRVVVATTGLAAGINFCMRSVLITERSYRSGNQERDLRPDELLQMFGRAGRRGFDPKGYVLVEQASPRRADARPLDLRRHTKLDWSTMMNVLWEASREGSDPAARLESFVGRLFSYEIEDFGFDVLGQERIAARQSRAPKQGEKVQTITEMLNFHGQWERARAPAAAQLGSAWLRVKDRWIPALKHPGTLAGLKLGTSCRLGRGETRAYGRLLALASVSRKEGSRSLVLSKQLYRELVHYHEAAGLDGKPPSRHWTREAIDKRLLKLIPALSGGGKVVSVYEKNGVLQAQLDYSQANVLARLDKGGHALINPPLRKVEVSAPTDMASLLKDQAEEEAVTLAEKWHRLGLIDRQAVPTRRGRLFSFFNSGEGLAVSVALEDESYPIEELLTDLANLRAGHRFEAWEGRGSRLGSICRLAFGHLHYPGYLERGLPPHYGEGCAQVLSDIEDNWDAHAKYLNEDLKTGDLERARLEWLSLLRQVAHAPDLEWERWRDLKQAAADCLQEKAPDNSPLNLPPLTRQQQAPFDCRVE